MRSPDQTRGPEDTSALLQKRFWEAIPRETAHPGPYHYVPVREGRGGVHCNGFCQTYRVPCLGCRIWRLQGFCTSFLSTMFQAFFGFGCDDHLGRAPAWEGQLGWILVPQGLQWFPETNAWQLWECQKTIHLEKENRSMQTHANT